LYLHMIGSVPGLEHKYKQHRSLTAKVLDLGVL
jgi:hypothetical protein